MKRKLISALLALTMVISMTACGGGSGASGDSGSGDAAADDGGAAADAGTDAAADSGAGQEDAAPVEGGSADENTLTVWTWDPNFNIYAIQKAAEIYAQDHEGFKVEVSEVQSDDIETRLTTAVAAGDLSTLPDIFLMQDNSFQKYATNYPDIFTDLTSSGIDFSQFSSAKVAYSTLDGKNYGIPFDNGAVINCMRTDYLEEAGFTIDDFTDITWSDYMEKAKVVLEKTGQPILTSQAGSPDLIMMMLQSCGSSLFNEDGSVNIAGNEELKQMMDIYVQMVADGTLVEVTDWDQYIASLNNGTAVSALNGCWIMASITVAEDQSGKWAITNMPKLDGVSNATNYSNNGGSSWAISSNCQKVDLAIDFMNSTFAGSNALYDDVISKGALATWAPAGESEAYNESVEFFGNDAIYAKIVEFATHTPSNITGAYYYDARDAVGVALSNICQQGADIDSEIQTAQETVEFNMGG
ncbi:ABC transporter substrate-binding protein [Parablautia muri]|uniref:Extracellular solute-binding protein n=1 Tax=Parablautia muri TaxID=2320879 RepID=A0A9X5BF08_9FIRM|nr:extracellular solute-binding protein [Parablautia muri]NBJ92700.1 extracellular solute-binding protein [Parablautia muri]